MSAAKEVGGGGIAVSLSPSPQSLSGFLSTTAGRSLARLILALIILAAWEYQPSADLRFWMSGPVEIVARLWSWILDGSLWENVGATLLAMSLGYAIGTSFGIALGLLFGLVPRLHRVLSPYIAALYAMPKIALAPAVRHRAGHRHRVRRSRWSRSLCSSWC